MEVENLVFNVKRTGDIAARGVDRLSNSLKKLKRSSESSNKGLGKVLHSFGRMTKIMILRQAIRALIKAMEEGLKSAYAFNSMAGGEMSAALDSLKSAAVQATGALGSAFGEMIATVAPILISLLNLITKVANGFAQLMAVLSGRSTYTKAIASSEKWAKATESGSKAAEEWKNQLMGFDEINRLEEPTDSSGGSGGSAPYEGAFELAKAENKWAEELRRLTLEWWESLDLEPITKAWNRLKDAVSGFVDLVDDALYWAYTNVLLPLAGWTIEKGAPAMVNLLASAINFLTSALRALSPAFLWIYDNVVLPVATFLGEVFVKVVNDLSATFQSLADKINNAKTLSEFLGSINGDEAFILAVASALTVLVGALAALKIVSTISALFQTAFTLMTNPIFLVITAIGLLAAAVFTHWDEIKETITAAYKKVKDNVEGVKDIIVNAGKAVANWWRTNVEKFKSTWSDFWSWLLDLVKQILGIASPSTVMADIGKNIMLGLINGIRNNFSGVFSAIDSIKSAFASIGDVISGVWSKVVGLFSDAKNTTMQLNEMNKAGGASPHSSSSYAAIHGRATGGFPDEGELFMARENGIPELVGQWGNKGAVANNEQIIEGIKQGVFEAVMQANSASESHGEQVWKVDGEVMARIVSKYQRFNAISANL